MNWQDDLDQRAEEYHGQQRQPYEPPPRLIFGWKAWEIAYILIFVCTVGAVVFAFWCGYQHNG